MQPPADQLEQKERALLDLLRGFGSAVVGFSGGVDSAYLAKAAVDALGEGKVLAVTGRSPSYPEVQRETAESVADSIDLQRVEIDTHELDDPHYAANPRNRCYYCKSELYGRLVALARERGFAVVLDGSNADDLDDHRPGMNAARELGVRSPLQEVGLTKDEIRALSRRAGLATWDLPASPCLASRIVYGLPVTDGRLARIEDAESRLRVLGRWGDLRVRHHENLGRLELDPDEVASVADPALRERVARALGEAGFERACLDLAGYRRGALNEPATDPEAAVRVGDRAEEAERRLAAMGVLARVESGGGEGEVAVLVPEDGGFQQLVGEYRDAVVGQCRGAGYRYVALVLGEH
jgi:uncharacterized protein